MMIDTSVSVSDRPDTGGSSSRRALIGAGLGALAALVASALGRPLPVRAGSDGDVVLGGYLPANDAGTSLTQVSSGSTEIPVLRGSAYAATGTAAGLSGGSLSATGYGVIGEAPGGTGVFGRSGGILPYPLPTAKSKTGVYGEATQGTASRGVSGLSGTGVGVYGRATDAAGYAFRGNGRVRFDKVSGLAKIVAGNTSLTITPGTDVASTSFVLLTPMADLGSRRLWFTRDTTNNRFTIHMSSSRSSGTSIAWLLLG